jgi:perosamine synthetase
MLERIGPRERAYVEEVLAAGFRSSAGSLMSSRLERAFTELIGSRFAIAFVNGTATMHAVLAASGIGPGDEVIVPPLTMASTALAVVHAGAVPVFADVEEGSMTVDPGSVAAAITSRTRAIVPVAIYGVAPDLDALERLAADRGLLLLEDDAQCILGSVGGRTVGTIGHAASFSFQSSKQLTSGEGGMVTTDDEELADAVRRFGSLGYRAVAAARGRISKADIQDPGYLRHGTIGFNYRMPELCAAVALAQVERADELIEARIRAALMLAAAVRGCPWLVPQSVPSGRRHVYWSYVLDLRSDAVSWHDLHAKFIELGGEGFYGCWAVNYLEPVFRGRRLCSWQPQEYGPGLCPVAEALQPRLLQLKTDYFDERDAARQADVLRQTIEFFDG